MLGKEHPEVANSLYHLGVLYDALEQYPEAKLLYEQSLAILVKTLGKKHPDTMTVAKNYQDFLEEISHPLH